MSLLDIEKCNCGREWCDFTDCSGDYCVSYSKEDLEEAIKHFKKLIKEVNARHKLSSK